MFQSKKKILGSSLLIMGAMIGVGMFALPVIQGAGGFFPGLFILALCWIYTVCAARLLLEACTWMPRGANFITIARHLVGKRGAFFCWFLYAFFFYCGMTAHIAAASDTIGQLSNHEFSNTLSAILYTAIFCGFVYYSLRASDFLNRIIIGALALTFLIFIISAFHDINPNFLLQHRWVYAWPAIHVVLYAFAFQSIIPPLYNYMDGDANAMKRAIWIGPSCTLVLYAIWNLMVMGIVPGKDLFDAFMVGDSPFHSLEIILQNSLISGIVQEFAILAISTSFLGMSISFFDFWADTLQWSKKGLQGAFLACLVFILPLIFALVYPNIFIRALDLGGEVGSSILLGLFPILFVWIGRYYKYPGITPELLPGGKTGLSILIAATLIFLALHHIFENFAGTAQF